MLDSLKGKLLIASPSIYDGNFRQTVVLIAEHNDEGAMGVVLNRPSETSIGEAAPQLAGVTDADDPVYVGGPVQPSSVIVLAEFQDPDEAALTILGDIGFVGVGSELDEVGEHVRRARVFAGHSGWAPEQLEAEMERDDWIVEEPARDDIFSDDAGELWQQVLARKGGQFAVMARMPFDPSVN